MAKLLIVDDEPSVCYSLEKRLRSETLEVLTAGTARQGLLLVEEHRPDVVLLDVQLPDQSGLDAFERMHELEPHLPVIIITAHATTETAIEAMKRGAFEYLLKPLDLPVLRDVVAKALEISRLSRTPTVYDQEDTEDPSVDRIVGLAPVM